VGFRRFRIEVVTGNLRPIRIGFCNFLRATYFAARDPPLLLYPADAQIGCCECNTGLIRCDDKSAASFSLFVQPVLIIDSISAKLTVSWQKVNEQGQYEGGEKQ
jgi:hypothetical protein